MRDVLRFATLAIVLMLASGTDALGQARQSGIQCTSDSNAVLVNKDVGDERWVITYSTGNGYTTGNVITEDGSVVFLSCEQESIRDGQINFSCATSGSCTADSCPEYTQAFPSSVNCGFFSAPCAPIPGRPDYSNGLVCQGMQPRFPFDSEQSCAEYAQSAGCGRFIYQTDPTNACSIFDCCSLPDDCDRQ